jgi:hypothetical protein
MPIGQINHWENRAWIMWQIQMNDWLIRHQMFNLSMWENRGVTKSVCKISGTSVDCRQEKWRLIRCVIGETRVLAICVPFAPEARAIHLRTRDPTCLQHDRGIFFTRSRNFAKITRLHKQSKLKTQARQIPSKKQTVTNGLKSNLGFRSEISTIFMFSS